MKKTEKQILLEGLRKIALDLTALADALEGKSPETATKKESETMPDIQQNNEQTAGTEKTKEIEQEPVKTYTFEEARGILADKARMGFSSDVKAILKANGVNKLSEITDPAVLAQVVAEAESIS